MGFSDSRAPGHLSLGWGGLAVIGLAESRQGTGSRVSWEAGMEPGEGLVRIGKSSSWALSEG